MFLGNVHCVKKKKKRFVFSINEETIALKLALMDMCMLASVNADTSLAHMCTHILERSHVHKIVLILTFFHIGLYMLALP